MRGVFGTALSAGFGVTAGHRPYTVAQPIHNAHLGAHHTVVVTSITMAASIYELNLYGPLSDFYTRTH